MAAAIGTIPSLSTYQPGALAVGSTVYLEIVDSLNATTALSWNIPQQDLVGKAPSVMNYNVPVATDQVAFYQRATGLPMQCNIGDLAIPSGNLPAGGGTGTLLAKVSATSFSANWTTISNLIAATSGLTNFGTATAVSIGIQTAAILSSMIASGAINTLQLANNAVGSAQLATGAVVGTSIANNVITSTQMANNAIGTNQIASSLGIASSLSIGTLVTVGGTATISGTAILNGGLQVSGSSILTGSFGVVGTSLMTGLFGVLGTTAFTGVHGVVGTSIITGTLGVNGTTIHTGTFVLGSLGAGIANVSATGVISSQGGMVLLNTLTPNGIASTNDTSSFTANYRNYMIMFDTVCPAAQTTTLQITLATSGSAFTTAGYVSLAQVDVNSVLVTDTSTAVLLMSGTRSTTQLQTSTVLGVSGFVKFFNPSSAVNNKTMVGEVMYPTPGAVGTTTLAVASINGVYTNASPVTGINFAFSSGNIQTGVIKIFGIT